MSRIRKPASRNPPDAHSKTGRVWEIADTLSKRLGRRADRKAVVDAAVAEGGNANTASTQYFHWKHQYDARHADRSEDLGSVRSTRLTIGKDGRVVIPSEMRAAMLLGEDGVVSAEVIDGELRILSPKGVVRHVQALARDLDRGQGSAVDELIAERREEARREDESPP
ncbi:MAG: hypothetical protein V7704_00675 [Aurantimonas endophytica]|uniref:hypothetical protein n=1 Tax=Aurantimonas endophytica TaxID=1522175 RepID=UPI0030015852